MREKPISATWGARCLVLAVLLASTVLGYGLSSKLSNDLQTKVGVAAPHATVDVIVRYKHKPGDAQFSKIVNKNGIIKNHLDVVNGAAFTVPVSMLSELDSDPDVEYVSPDRPVRGAATSSITLDYYNPTVNANYASQLGYDGTGIGVAVIDSGIVDVPDLSVPNQYYPNQQTAPNFRVVYSQDFVTGGSAVDLYGHGTHVSGILGGNATSIHGLGLLLLLRRNCAQRQPDQPAGAGPERPGHG